MSKPQAGFAPQHRVYAAFFIYSLILGAIFPRLGDLQLKMDIGESALGLSLLGFAIGTQISLMFAGPMLDRFGYRLVLMLCIPTIGLAETAATLAPTPQLVFVSLFFAGLAIGAIEIVLNLEADRTEYQIGRRIMNRSHAFWSIGFFAAGLLGAIAGGMKIDPTLHIFAITLFVMLAVFVVFAGFVPAPLRPVEPKEQGETVAPKFVRPSKAILLIVAFTLSAMLLEGASADWSVIFMRDTFATAPFISGIAFAIGAFSQAAGRFFADGFVDKYGPISVSRVLVLILGIGVLMVVFATLPAIALIGFALVGLGTSSIFPLAMSAAAQRTDRPAALNVASLAQLSFIVFLIAPPLLGFIAEHFGIRMSFAVGIPLVVISWFTISSLSGEQEAAVQSKA